MATNGGRCLLRILLLLLAAGVAFAAARPAAAQNVVIYAAASLANALDAVDAEQRKRGGAKAVISYASSSTLARQIENGAPADIFISADLEWLDYLDRRGLVSAGTRANLLRNELVLIAPAASRASLTIGPGFPLAKLLGDGRLAMGDPDHVPAGKYAKAALVHLDVWSAVAGRIARAENVRAALNFVSRGEAAFGIVYRTDAAADRNVRVVGAFPADSHPPVIYPAAMISSGKVPAAAKYFAFMKSAEAAAIFRQHGFVPY